MNRRCHSITGGSIKITSPDNPFKMLNLYIFTLLVWACFVSLHPINVKTIKPIGPKFYVGPHLPWPQERFMDVQNWKSYVQKLLIFEKFWKSTQKYYQIRELFCDCFFITPESLVFIKYGIYLYSPFKIFKNVLSIFKAKKTVPIHHKN